MIMITVSGPGGNISYEMEMLRILFESEGYQVRVQNEHPFVANDLERSTQFASWEEYQAHRRKLTAERNLMNKPTEIVLVANHIPWGG